MLIQTLEEPASDPLGVEGLVDAFVSCDRVASIPSNRRADLSATEIHQQWIASLRQGTSARFHLRKVVGARNDAQPAPTDPVLAAYVWNFKITTYDANGTVITTYPCVCDQGAVTPAMLPAAVEISFNAMSPQAAQAMMSVSSSPNDWMDTTTQNYQRLIAPHAYQFRSRINLP